MYRSNMYTNSIVLTVVMLALGSSPHHSVSGQTSTTTFSHEVFLFVNEPRSVIDTNERITDLVTKIKTAVAMASIATGNNPPRAVITAAESAVGTVQCNPSEVRAFNKTSSIVPITCSSEKTAKAVVELARFSSWNLLKATGVIYASEKKPAGDRVSDGLSMGVIVGLAVFTFLCSTVASTWMFARSKVKKTRGISFNDIARLETELVAAMDEKQRYSQSQFNSLHSGVSMPEDDMEQDELQMLHHHQLQPSRGGALPLVSAVRRSASRPQSQEKL